MDPQEQQGEEQRLEHLIGHELRQLRDLPAPETLFHRIMLAVHERERRPWWQRSWQQWPRGAQGVALVLLVGCAVVVFGLVSGISWGIDPSEAWTTAAGWGKRTVPGWGILGTLANAGAVVFKTMGQQVLLVGSVVVLAVYAIGVGLTTACYRLARTRN